VLIGVAVTWLALALAYLTPYPVGFYATTIAFALYATAAAGRRQVRG
jgi:zinc/manganese transport system permease protein